MYSEIESKMCIFLKDNLRFYIRRGNFRSKNIRIEQKGTNVTSSLLNSKFLQIMQRYQVLKVFQVSKTSHKQIQNIESLR